ncbi:MULTISPECIES: PTS sugar transporter subunit IIC [Erwinia]|jgi:PTS system ascorbate-specific IIC component|uniref:Ascorbate-specific PTS system EIIC component n=1 Tax=Erwinia billingiae (strain Eb661) TaxID=634500 RepID=D8MWV8_ERWBE|nr:MULTISPECIES: PTS sugar transporter subunit IIC [Erwinia]MBN7122262.1 PTS ascorbate transporter subunit IIC [Erwinia billingiae]PRB59501.1 PTS ascorbate transporter subunit IIC [Erwinia billingiae]QBR49091.1 PTS sugar transporter subunit IIC [Erwinia sp. QL-Z3]QEW30825.1 PTS sugar transporter subunit IIC [Erwinia billingiae]CAX61315.1 PTS system, mannitol-specific EIIC component [Erwinia billingiae Eb661]
MSFLNFIVHDVLGQASILISLIAMIGLISLKKSPGQVITGTLKTLLGFLVILAGANIIVGTLTFLGEIFQKGFHMRGVVTDVGSIAGIAQQTLGSETALIMVIAFIVNIAIARFTRYKYIFLTGQASLWMATVCSVIGYMGGLRGVELIVLGGVIAGMMAVFMPALAQPIVRKITGGDDFALGHFCTVGYIVQAGVAKVTGDVSKSTEDLELPQALSFLQDTYLSMMVVMIPIYLIPAIVAGPEVVAASSNGVNYLVYSFLQAIQFVVGVYVLLSGVRLLLAEIVPAFRGIALRIVPNAVPALDCPVLFPYAPNAVIIGFISTTIGSVIGMLLFPWVGLAMILPGMLTNFFAGGTAGIFANAVGGRRGAIIGGVFHGLFITLLPALLLPLLGQYGMANVTFSDSDVISVGLIFGHILNFFH